MSPRPPALAAIMSAARRLVHRRVARALLAAVAALIPLALGLAWLGGSRWLRPSPWPLLLDLAAIAAAIALFTWWRRVLRPRLDERAVAAAAEDRLGLPRGAVGGVLELQRALPAGTSVALARRAEASLSALVAGRAPAELSGALGERWRRRERSAALGLLGLVAVVAMLGFAAPERTRAGWAPLLHPLRHLSPPPLAPLRVQPGHAAVARGSALAVHVRAPGREAVVLKWHLAGDVLHDVVLPVRGDSARGEIPAVDAAGRYWVEAPDGARSARFRLEPVDALLIAELAVDILYPAYLERPAEHYEGELPPLEVPAGTTLRIRGRATRPLRQAALQGAEGMSELQVSGDRFAGRWTPQRTGVYGWALRADGAVSGLAPTPIEIVVVPDLPPAVTITFPGADTIAPADLRQPLLAEARDDHRLAGAVLVSWRVSSAGVADSTITSGIPVDAAERALLSAVLDLSARGLLPGDTLKYFVRVHDASPAGQTGVSETYTLRVPTAEQLRLRAQEQARAALARAEALTGDAAEMASRTRAAQRRAEGANARRAHRSDGRPGGSGERAGARMDFAETEAARAILRDQEQLLERVAQLRESMATLEKSVTEAGLRDRELQAQLDELRALTEQLLTPEMQRQLEQLQQSLQNLDGAQLQQALERLAQQQQDLKQQLEQQLELMRRAAAAQELGSLAQQARELATQQEALAKAHQQPPADPRAGVEQAAAQERLAAQGEQLAKDLEQLDQELGAQGADAAREQTAQAARRARAAESAMQQAARSAGEQRGEDAARQGRQAAAQLDEAATSLEQARGGMADAGRDEAREAMEQASREALELAQRQLELQQRMQAGESGDSATRAQAGAQLPRPGLQSAGEEGGGNSLPRPAIPQGAGAQSGQQGGDRPAKPSSSQGGTQQGEKSSAGQQGGSQQGGHQSGARQGGAQQGGNQQGGARPPRGTEAGAGGQSQAGMSPSAAELAQLQAEQGALQEGLGQLAQNVAESGNTQGALSRDVTAAMGRANLAMQQTQQGLTAAAQGGDLPVEQAGQSVESLNRLALALLNNARQLEQAQGGSGGGQQARQQLADLAQAQASLNGQGSSLLPLGLEQGATADQARRLGREQLQMAQRLGGMNNLPGGREDVLGELDLLAREANALARELQGGRIPPDVIARQERLFHRLLDAGRALEREETSEEREAERPGRIPPSVVPPLDPALLRDASRFRQPTPEELRALPPAYRRLILDYFDRLNRPLPPTAPPPG